MTNKYSKIIPNIFKITIENWDRGSIILPVHVFDYQTLDYNLKSLFKYLLDNHKEFIQMLSENNDFRVISDDFNEFNLDIESNIISLLSDNTHIYIELVS